MLNDFTGGGQVFLHKVRMFMQVLHKSFITAFLVILAILVVVSFKAFMRLDLAATTTYQKAKFVGGLDDVMRPFRSNKGSRAGGYYTPIDAWTKKGLYARDIKPAKVLSSNIFKSAYG